MRSEPRPHAGMEHFPVRDNVLQVAGQPLTAIAQQVGQTPFYVYDRQLISDRIGQLRAALPPRIQLHYAIKANPMAGLVQFISPLVDGLDIASLGEMRLALQTPTRAGNISFAGPGKSNEELEAAVAAGVVINIESDGEMQRLAAISDRLDRRAQITIRVNPDFEVKGSGMKMGGGPRPFGVDSEKVPALIAAISNTNLDLLGFHIYWGSQNLCAEHIVEAQEMTFALASQLSRHCSHPIRLLNIGGGLGIPYFPGEQRLNLQQVGDGMAQILDRYPEFAATNIVMELGRYMVGEAGLYVCEVLERKESRGETFLVTNGGLHHHLAVSGNFGQIIRKNYPVCIGNRVKDSTTERAIIVGPLCTPLDILADKIELPRARPGDLVVVYQSGAYGLSASPQEFLSHPRAKEILL
ncbi:pyridoxal-dependent decarboxylase, exosortase A system-associated [Pseudomaricurvus sp. HS19]|uniref:pyridoxal-dependent decarboxylase, exosortase A system-associated n=1 Tax=Pseudomaricurvus sp. HS19 TaxID=2692626 RepID=UPI0019273C10|nr:pyridoxal-dependent decarboxylase, exosortase A system-associated [Pseudomaricurvus sp. HS19]